jgi:hypothetical protein
LGAAIYRFRLRRMLAMYRLAAAEPFTSRAGRFALARRRRFGAAAFVFRFRRRAGVRPPFAPDAFAMSHCVAGVDWPTAL